MNWIIVYGIIIIALLTSIAVLAYLLITSNDKKALQQSLPQTESTSIASPSPSPVPPIIQPTIPPQPPIQPTIPPQPIKPIPIIQPTQKSPAQPIIQKSLPIVTGSQPPIPDNQKLPVAANTTPSAVDKELCDLINKHRGTLNLSPIPFSNGAWLVAANHTWDQANNKSSCSLHSWSDRPGAWTGCCYNVSSPNGNCMWAKSKEIAGLSSRGYEIAAGGGGNMAASSALQMWLGDDPHKSVIENTGMWANKKWTGFGCSVSNGYADCWFLD